MHMLVFKYYKAFSHDNIVAVQQPLPKEVTVFEVVMIQVCLLPHLSVKLSPITDILFDE